MGVGPEMPAFELPDEEGRPFNLPERLEGSTRHRPQDRSDGVPVIKIGNHWIAGFDKERIEKELGLDYAKALAQP